MRIREKILVIKKIVNIKIKFNVKKINFQKLNKFNRNMPLGINSQLNYQVFPFIYLFKSSEIQIQTETVTFQMCIYSVIDLCYY